MSNTPAADLRKMSVKDLKELTSKLTREYVTLKMQLGAGKDKAPSHLLRSIRVQIARIKTVLRERREV